MDGLEARAPNARFLDFNLENGCVQSQSGQWDHRVGVPHCSAGTTWTALSVASADELGSLLYILLALYPPIFHYMSSYFPSIFSIVAALSAENMKEASSHSHKSVGSNILIYTSKSFLIPLALQMHTRHLPIEGCSDVGLSGIVALSNRH